MSTTLGERVKAALAGPPKLTQKALAEACGVSPVSINDWVHDRTQTIEGANLLNAAQFLQVNARWLAEGVGPMRPMPPLSNSSSQEPSKESMAREPGQIGHIKHRPDVKWPFHLVSYQRLMTLKRGLGPKIGPAAIVDMDKTLEIAVLKWERELAQLKIPQSG